MQSLFKLFLVFCLGFFLDPAMTTQDSSQTQMNSVTGMQVGHESSGNCFISVHLKL